MCETLKVKAGDIFPVIEELIQMGSKVWITVTGMSMYPFLREEKDCVQLAGTDFKAVEKGDIVLVRRVTGEYVLHRVMRKRANAFFMIGDAQSWVEGPVFPEQLLAKVEYVRRNGRDISCGRPVLKLLALAWLNIIPVRRYILRVIRISENIKQRVKKEGKSRRCKVENT